MRNQFVILILLLSIAGCGDDPVEPQITGFRIDEIVLTKVAPTFPDGRSWDTLNDTEPDIFYDVIQDDGFDHIIPNGIGRDVKTNVRIPEDLPVNWMRYPSYSYTDFSKKMTLYIYDSEIDEDERLSATIMDKIDFNGNILKANNSYPTTIILKSSSEKTEVTLKIIWTK